jgi:uncharacterized protein with PQ loop repeat
MSVDLPLAAGVLSTIIFAISTLPMLVKAARTKDLQSYSPGQILLANAGNVIHSFYIFDLPMGPVWVLHTFYLLSTALMLFWYVRYSWRGRSEPRRRRLPRVRLRAGPAAYRVLGSGDGTEDLVLPSGVRHELAGTEELRHGANVGGLFTEPGGQPEPHVE